MARKLLTYIGNFVAQVYTATLKSNGIIQLSRCHNTGLMIHSIQPCTPALMYFAAHPVNTHTAKQRHNAIQPRFATLGLLNMMQCVPSPKDAVMYVLHTTC